MIEYQQVPPQYLEQRMLRRSAGWVLLWALGVGAVISGDFFGWNFGLSAAGTGGLAIATVIVATMYVCLVCSIAELSAALPHAGGFYSFARQAFGPWGGFLVGVTDTIEYVLTPAVIVVGIGGYLATLLPGLSPLACWLVVYAVFVGINIRGAELTLKIGLAITLLALAVLAVFYASVLGTHAFHAHLLTNVPPVNGNSAWLPHGWYGVFSALPFAIWFYLAIEQLPLAAEESVAAARDMPRALIVGTLTLLLLSIATLVLNTGVGGGAAQIGVSQAPLVDGFRAVFATGTTTTLLTLIALTGLIASFHSTIYAYGRVIFALSRAGYYPQWLSPTGESTRTPHRALLVGAAIGVLSAVVMARGGSGAVGAALLNMAVFGAVLSYAAVMLAYVRLRYTHSHLARPYRSPLGVPGAVLGTVLALLSLAATFARADYRSSVYGVAIILVLAVCYFAFYSSRKLVAQAPEEASALENA